MKYRWNALFQERRRFLDGVITEIQRFSVHDGPGIRTTVFFKGCPMRCKWCHNPETLSIKPQIAFYKERCIRCGACSSVCPVGAHKADGTKDFSNCLICGACARACQTNAIAIAGKKIAVEAVVAEVLKDKPYYEETEGGATLSGGEFALQAEFALELIEALKREEIHVAVETGLGVPWSGLAPLLELIDLAIADIKVFDDDSHKKWTGVSNRRILENARKLLESGKPVIIRTPVIPGANDSEDEIAKIASFLKGYKNLVYYELLPYNPIGEDKYNRFGMPFALKGLARPEKAQMAKLVQAARDCGVNALSAYLESCS
jgi:pyruvate formate lyase activating enzyme